MIDARWVHRYVSPRDRALSVDERRVRAIAYAIKGSDVPDVTWDRALYTAARAMAERLPGDDVQLVPIPDSSGDRGANHVLAQRIAALSGRPIQVLDVLRRKEPVESSRKRRTEGDHGLLPDQHHFFVTPHPDLDPRKVVFVDNVATTGGTLEAARMALGAGRGLVWAKASPRPGEPDWCASEGCSFEAGGPVEDDLPFWVGMPGVEQDPWERSRLQEELLSINKPEHPMGNAPKRWSPRSIRDPKRYQEGVDRKREIQSRLGTARWQHTPERSGVPKARHRKMVEDALAAGYPIPAPVLEAHGLDRSTLSLPDTIDVTPPAPPSTLVDTTGRPNRGRANIGKRLAYARKTFGERAAFGARWTLVVPESGYPLIDYMDDDQVTKLLETGLIYGGRRVDAHLDQQRTRWERYVPWLAKSYHWALKIDSPVQRGNALRSIHEGWPEVRDWMVATRPDVSGLHWYDARDQARAWHVELREKAQAKKGREGRVLYRWEDDWTMQELTTRAQLEEEGEAMGHCVGSYAEDVARGEIQILSLRDPKGQSHVTIEIDLTRRLPGLEQCKGKGNQTPAPTYRTRVLDYLWDFLSLPGDGPSDLSSMSPECRERIEQRLGSDGVRLLDPDLAAEIALRAGAAGLSRHAMTRTLETNAHPLLGFFRELTAIGSGFPAEPRDLRVPGGIVYSTKSDPGFRRDLPWTSRVRWTLETGPDGEPGLDLIAEWDLYPLLRTRSERPPVKKTGPSLWTVDLEEVRDDLMGLPELAELIVPGETEIWSPIRDQGYSNHHSMAPWQFSTEEKEWRWGQMVFRKKTFLPVPWRADDLNALKLPADEFEHGIRFPYFLTWIRKKPTKGSYLYGVLRPLSEYSEQLYAIIKDLAR